MPAIDTVSNRAAPKPKRRPEPRPKSKPQPQRRVVRVTPDHVDRQRAVRETQRRASMSPDTQDRNRAPEQQARDRDVVKQTVREARLRAIHTEKSAAATRRTQAIKDRLPGGYKDPLFGPRGVMRNGIVNERETERLKREGVKVRSLSKTESRDVGATQGTPTVNIGAPARMAQAIGIATAQDPGGVTKKTLGGFRDMATGAPAALVKTLTTDPRETLAEMGGDYKRRYGGISEPGGLERAVERIKKEGAAPELVDAVSIGVPLGKATDALLGGAARSGGFGARLQRATTGERPSMRTSGNTSREQTRSKGLAASLRENRRDKRAREAVVREVHGADEAARAAAARKAGGRAVDPRSTHGEVDAVVREAYTRGEVMPTRMSRPGRRAISDRKIEKAQRRAYAGEKGRALHSQREEQRQEIFRGSHKNLAGLNEREQRTFKYAMQSGATTPKAGRQALERQRALIVKTRRDGNDTSNTDVDELPVIDAILAEPGRHFTPRLERAVRLEMERGARVGEGDPSLGKTELERADAAESRRLAPSAELFAVKRGGTPVLEAERIAGERIKGSSRRLAAAKAEHQRAERRAAAATGYAQAGADRSKRALGHRRRRDEAGNVVGDGRGPIGRAERAAEAHENAAKNWEALAAKARKPGTRKDYEERAARAYDRATAARSRLESLEGGQLAARPEYRRAVQKARGRAADAARDVQHREGELRGHEEERARIRGQRRAGARLVDAEPMDEFKQRVRDARPEGFAEPGFFPSVRRERTKFAPFTIGGARRTKPDKRYEGKLFRAGREDGSTTSYEQALAKNIKRKWNWKLIGDTMAAHAFEWSKKTNADGELRGLKYGELEDELARRGIDPQSVRIVDMDAFDGGAVRAADVGDAGNVQERTLHESLSTAMDTEAINRAAELEPGAGRLVVLPKHVGDEILSDTKPSGVFGRGLDIAKGKQARIMLGLSPAWLQFQVAANVIQSALATKSLPGEWIYANAKWWKSLKPEERKALEPYVGLGAFHDSLESPKMGAAAQGGLINSYRAFKAHEFWHKPRRATRGRSVSQLNPLDTLFRLDNAQNNFFRRAVLYNNLKRQAYDRMGTSMISGQRAMSKVIGAAGEDPQKMIRALVHERKAVEQAAESVNDFLGDYMTYTAKERRWLQRNVMFYGYLRFSLRFTFYTMPVKHPVMTSIIAQLGGINAREVRELLGGDELPWALGKLYWTKDGKLKEIDLSRANPFMNAITQAKIPEKGAVRGLLQSAIGFLPPMLGSAANIAFSKSLYKDRAYKVNGESSARPNKEGQAITDADALQIFGKEMLGLVALYRMEEKARADGRPISDDSIVGVNENYTEYKDAKLQTDTRRAQRETSPGKIRVQQLVPMLPRDSRDVETAAKIRRARGEKAEPGSAPATAAGPGDDETTKLFEQYSGNAVENMPDADELEKLLQTYGAGG